MGRSVSKASNSVKPQMSLAVTGPSVCTALQDWRTEVCAELRLLALDWHWAYWPACVLDLLEHWDLLLDERWRSRLLWQDYLQTYERERSEVVQGTWSTLAVPLEQKPPHKEAKPALVTGLKAHLRDTKTHGIAAMIACFAREFYSFYAVAPLSDDPFELAIDLQSPKDALRISSEVRAFISLCEKAINVYYNSADLPSALVHELVVERVFTTQVNEVLLAVFAADDREKMLKIEAKAGLYADLTCSSLGISPFFSVDRTKPGQSPDSAYEKAILALKGLPTAISPYKKLKFLVKTTHLICKSIDAYWADTPDMDRALLEVTTDQILRIYLYLVLQARAPALGLHVRMMQEFLGKDVLQSAFGYYVSTLEAAVEWTAELNSAFLGKLIGK